MLLKNETEMSTAQQRHYEVKSRLRLKEEVHFADEGVATLELNLIFDQERVQNSSFSSKPILSNDFNDIHDATIIFCSACKNFAITTLPN